MREKPYAPACERNQDPILSVLRRYLSAPGAVFEIGSGTGQHAVYFSRHLPHLQWQTSDRAECLDGIEAWLGEAALPNTKAPMALDVLSPPPLPHFDHVFTANTLHIMSWIAVEACLELVGRHLPGDGQLIVYGPFNYQGRYTSASNAEFDRWLKARDPASGIRDFEAVDALAERQGLRLCEDVEMPANNRLLIWRREIAERQA